MFEIKIVLFSKAESLLGLYLDQGEFEKGDSNWTPFTRFRIGLIFFTIDFINFKKGGN